MLSVSEDPCKFEILKIKRDYRISIILQNLDSAPLWSIKLIKQTKNTLDFALFNVIMPKCAFKDVCPRGSATGHTFSNSEMSDFDPRGRGSPFFKTIWNSKKSELSDRGGSGLIGIFPQFFCVFYFWKFRVHPPWSFLKIPIGMRVKCVFFTRTLP